MIDYGLWYMKKCPPRNVGPACDEMADSVSRQERSMIMSRVRSRDTRPEKRVRSILHSLGYRFRLSTRAVPGHPDIVFSRRHKVIFVHGCFWHRHLGCPKTRIPKSNTEFWIAKFQENVARDKRVMELIGHEGWQSLVLWECETNSIPLVVNRVKCFLGEPRASS